MEKGNDGSGQSPLTDAAEKLGRRIRFELEAITAQRQEICRAFLAKYGCGPDDLEQVIQHLPDGTVWFVRRKASNASPATAREPEQSPVTSELLGSEQEREGA